MSTFKTGYLENNNQSINIVLFTYSAVWIVSPLVDGGRLNIHDCIVKYLPTLTVPINQSSILVHTKESMEQGVKINILHWGRFGFQERMSAFTNTLSLNHTLHHTKRYIDCFFLHFQYPYDLKRILLYLQLTSH